MKFIELKKQAAIRREACYLLSGDDPFILSSAVKFFESLCDLPEMNLVRLNCPSASDIVGAAVVFPVMSEVRVVIVENFDKDATELKKYLSDPSPSTVIVIVSPSLTKNLSLISDKVTVVDCSRQEPSVISAYIARECAKFGVTMTASAADLLTESCNRYMVRISVELIKLISYSGEGGRIEASDVSAMVAADPEYKVYELGDCIASRNGEKAMTILGDMLSSGNTASVFGMIYSHFRKLLYVSVDKSDDELKKCLGISDYPLKKLKAQAKAYSPVKLKKICDELHKVDSDYKNGLIEDKLAITAFALHIVNEGR